MTKGNNIVRDTKIKCSNCGFEIPAEDSLLKQAEERIKLEVEEKTADKARILSKQKKLFEKEKQDFNEMKETEEALYKKGVDDVFQKEKEKLKKEAVKELESKIILIELENEKKEKENRELKQREVSLTEKEKVKLKREAVKELEGKIILIELENEKKEKENRELKQREVLLMEKEKELIEKQEEVEIDLQKMLLIEKNKIENEVKKKENERYELLIKQYDKKISDQKLLIEELKRKEEQVLIDMKKEEQNFILEEILSNEFSNDDIKAGGVESKDIELIQTVNNEKQQVCGRIIYISKKKEPFSEEWIKEANNVQIKTDTDLVVIVSNVLPEEMKGSVFKDGIWICNYSESRNLISVLREMLIREYTIKSLVQNKEIKLDRMDDYLAGEGFKNNVETIVDGFSALKEQIDKERRAMQNIWMQREKQIEIVIDNTIEMYGSIKGIGGKEIKEIKQLELSDKSEEE